MLAEPEYGRGGWAIPSRAAGREGGESGAAKRSLRHAGAGMPFANSGGAADRVPEPREDEYDEELDYEGDSPEMSKEQFREAILLEWRERTDEIKRQNDDLEDKNEYSRFEHPSIMNFAKAVAAQGSRASSEKSFAAESTAQSSSLHVIRKRFAADDSLDLESSSRS